MNLKKIRNILCIAVLLIAAAGTFVLFAYPRFVEPVVKYNEAQSLYESGDYLRAAMQFSALGGKRDSAQKAADAWCSAGEAALARGDAETAYACFKSAGMPEAEQLRQDECFFELGKNAYAAGDYNRAEICFDSITDKSGFAARTDEVRIAAAESFLGAGEMPQAMRCFSLCSDESKSNICRIYITQGENLLQNFEIESAYKCFNGAKNNCSDDALADLLQKINSAWESAGQRAMEAGKYEIATECYSMSDGFSPDEVIAERDAARYEKAVEAYQKKNYLEALTLLNSVSEGYEQSADMIAEILKMLQSTPAAGGKDCASLHQAEATPKAPLRRAARIFMRCGILTEPFRSRVPAGRAKRSRGAGYVRSLSEGKTSFSACGRTAPLRLPGNLPMTAPALVRGPISFRSPAD